jgi:hypothetical protein
VGVTVLSDKGVNCKELSLSLNSEARVSRAKRIALVTAQINTLIGQSHSAKQRAALRSWDLVRAVPAVAHLKIVYALIVGLPAVHLLFWVFPNLLVTLYGIIAMQPTGRVDQACLVPHPAVP